MQDKDQLGLMRPHRYCTPATSTPAPMAINHASRCALPPALSSKAISTIASGTINHERNTVITRADYKANAD